MRGLVDQCFHNVNSKAPMSTARSDMKEFMQNVAENAASGMPFAPLAPQCENVNETIDALRQAGFGNGQRTVRTVDPISQRFIETVVQSAAQENGSVPRPIRSIPNARIMGRQPGLESESKVLGGGSSGRETDRGEDTEVNDAEGKTKGELWVLTGAFVTMIAAGSYYLFKV